MADVAVPGRESARTRRERAQLLILIGIVLALVLVSLALFLNGIIYAENAGARGADIGGAEARGFVASSEAGAEGALRAANRGNVSYEEQTDAFNDSVRDWNGQSRLHYTSSGSYTTVAPTDEFRQGTQIVQDDARPFTAADGRSDWTLASDVRARAYVLNVTAVSASDDDPFTLCVTEAGVLDAADPTGCAALSDAGTLSIGETGSGDINVTAEGADGTASTEVDEGWVRIDFADGTVNGEPFGLETVFAGFESYDVAYLGGDGVEGTYRLVVDKKPDEVRSGLDTVLFDSVYNDPDDDPPYAYDAIWSADVDVIYESSQIEYRSTITIVPGEIRD